MDHVISHVGTAKDIENQLYVLQIYNHEKWQHVLKTKTAVETYN
jgi:hypothetical protein